MCNDMGEIADPVVDDDVETATTSAVLSGRAITKCAHTVVRELQRHGRKLALAESLTGGSVAAAIVDIAGASEILRGSVVSYASDLKVSVLGVNADLVREHGVVNAQTALQMARGAASVLGADIAVATTGVAGPGPSEGCDAGTVYLASVIGSSEVVMKCLFVGDRNAVRKRTTLAALQLVLAHLWQNTAN